MTVGAPTSRRGALRPLLVALGTVGALVGYSILAASAGLTMSLAWPFAAVGVTFGLAAGVLGWHRPNGSTWWLLALAGVLWFAQALVLADNDVIVRIGQGLQRRHLIVMLHMALAMPTGRLRSPAQRWIVATAYVEAVVVAVIDDATGWACSAVNAACTGPAQFTDLSPPGRVMTVAAHALVIVTVLAAIVVIVRHLRTCDRSTRRAAAPVLAALTLHALVFVAVDDFDLVTNGPIRRWLDLGTAALLPLSVLVGVALVELHRARIADLVLALDRAVTPVELRDLLAATLGDDSLTLCFPDDRGFVDHHGEPIEPGQAGRATTCVEHDGDVIAVLDHVPALTHEADLLASTIAASRLALENARLTTLVQAQLIDIATSRRHLVDAGLRERRRIERDLHDGAQQRLLAVALGLAVAQRSADRNGDPQMASMLNTLGIDLEHAIDELRDLARGLYPTVLTDRGLPAAVDALAQRAPLPLDVDLTLPRLDSGVEATAYFVIVEALANTIRHAAASAVRITGRLAENHLTIAVIDDGRGGAVIDPARGGSGLRGLDDRARALGGRVTVRSPTAAGTTVTLELPVDAQP